MENKPLNIYSLICSRDSNFSETTISLFQYFKEAGVTVKSLVGFNSIFEAYEKGFKSLNANDEDIIIFCHDDIEFKTSPKDFVNILKGYSSTDKGFVGVAGTRRLEDNGVWWNWNQPDFMSGKVWHGEKNKDRETYFGACGKVVVLDGLFLACRASLLKSVSLKKPDAFIGNWDYYDILYTFQAHLLGFSNQTVPIILRHESPGQPRETWNLNRLAFIESFKDKLPLQI